MATLTVTPNAGDIISDTEQPIRLNFGSISTAFNLNHGDFGAGNEGKHEFLQMPEQVGAPTTLANEAALYAAVGVTSTVSELVFRRENNGTSIPFTEGTLATPGWTRFPSGLIIKFGLVTSNGATAFNVAQTHVYGIGPAFTTVYQVQVTTVPLGAPPSNNQLDTFAQPLDWTSNVAQFTYFAGQRTTGTTRQTHFSFVAIGS